MNETQRALMEGARNAASDAYFGARPQIDTMDRRRVFEAGFDMAWKEMLPTQCDCTTKTHPDGKQETYCGSDQMMRSLKPSDETMRDLLRRGMLQLALWHEKYGDNGPAWLPPAGDVRWLEDVCAAMKPPNAVLTGAAK